MELTLIKHPDGGKKTHSNLCLELFSISIGF